MELEKLINKFIYEYPTLYRSRNHESSRLHVLGHIFVSYGTALAWCKDGYLYSVIRHDDPFAVPPMDSLPENFYDMKLWKVDLEEDRVEDFKKTMEGKFYYFRPRCLEGDRQAFFEGDEEFAKNIIIDFQCNKDCFYRDLKNEDKEIVKRSLRIRMAVSHDISYDRKGYNPSDLCEYSPLMEMLDGKTNSFDIENFELKYIKPDWLNGAIDIAEFCLKYWNDDSRNIENYQHPDRCLRQFQDLYEEDPEEFHRRENWGKGMTIEQYCWSCWEECKKNELKKYEMFLQKFKR